MSKVTHFEFSADGVVAVVVGPPPRISWSSHLITPYRCQSRFQLLD